MHVRACRYVCVCVGKIGLFRELNPGPPAPEAGIIPLDQTAKCFAYTLLRGCFWFGVVVLGGWRGRCLAVVARCLLSLGSIPTGGCVALMFCTCGGFWFFGFAVGRCCNSPHWGLNPGPSVYKTDALPLSYRGVAFRRRGGIEPLHVSMPRELKSRPGTSPTHPGCSRAAPMLAVLVSCVVGLRMFAKATARGFEPLRAEPNGFLVHHINHSVTVSSQCSRCHTGNTASIFIDRQFIA